MFLNVLGYSTLAGVATIAGTLLILHRYDWGKHNSTHLMSFAAGIMLALAILHLIPEAVHITYEAQEHLAEAEHEEIQHEHEAHATESEQEAQLVFIMVLLGFVAFYTMESMVMLHPRHDVEAEEAHKHSSLSIIAIVGLTFHSLLDGVIIAVGFKAGSQIGVMTTVAVILHEMPEGMVTTSILLHDAMERVKVFWFSLMVAVATPVAAVVSYFILGEASENILKSLLAIAAGSFIYIAAADLIPETHKEEKWFNTVVLIIGMTTMYAIGRLLGHGH